MITEVSSCSLCLLRALRGAKLTNIPAIKNNGNSYPQEKANSSEICHEFFPLMLTSRSGLKDPINLRLRTLESYNLLKNGILYEYPSLKHDLDTDVLVIGGGITGALISYQLIKMGKHVTLIDKRDIAQGSTAATTSMIQYEIDVPMIRLSKIIGEEGAAICFREGINAISDLENVVKENNIDCGFQMRKSIYLAHNDKSTKWLKKEFELRLKHGLKVDWMERTKIIEEFGLHSPGAIISQCGAGVDAFKLCHELISLSVSKGLKVYDQTCITSHKSKIDDHTLLTDTGQTIHAKKVVYCNGFEAVDMLSEKVCDLFFTYASVSEAGVNLPEKLKQCLLWTTHDPYLYMRVTDDDRLLVGGGDRKWNRFANQQKTKDKRMKLVMQELHSLLPALNYFEDFTWGGVFGSTKDGLPYVGESSEYPGSFFVLGFGGNGITFSVQAMKMLEAKWNGQAHPLENYYRFGR